MLKEELKQKENSLNDLKLATERESSTSQSKTLEALKQTELLRLTISTLEKKVIHKDSERTDLDLRISELENETKMLKGDLEKEKS